MNKQSLASPTNADEKRAINRLLVFFALVYVIEGLGQIGGLISQPLSYYLKETQGWTPVQVTAFVTIFNLPWVIKPLYGLLSDFVPLFGYRRKSYLILANIAGIGGYFWITRLTEPNVLLVALMLTAYAMAISSTLCGAVLVENGQRLHESGTFVNQQWLWFNIAAMGAAILGGELVQHLAPASALHAAAAIVAAAPFSVIFGTLFLIEEKKTPINVQGLKATLNGLMTAFKRRELLIAAGFIFLYYFSPGLSTPLYYHMTDDLHFFAGLYRHIVVDRVGRLDHRRPALSQVFRGADHAHPSQYQHCARYIDDCGVSSARQRSVGDHHQSLRRLFHDVGDRRDAHARGRLLSAPCRRIFVCGADVDHQLRQYSRRQSRLLSVCQCPAQEPAATCRDIGGVHSIRFRPGATPAPWQ